MSRLGYVNLQRRVAGRSKRFWLKELTPEQRMKRDLARQLGLG
jgi:predicted transcriptional regulator